MKALKIALCVGGAGLSLAILVFLLLASFPQSQSNPYEVDNFYDRSSLGVYGKIVFYVCWQYMNVPEDIILNYSYMNRWNDSSIAIIRAMSDIPVIVYDKNLGLLAQYRTGQDGRVEVAASELGDTSEIYVKVIATVHFMEGGKESYFFWYKFLLDPSSTKTFTENVFYQHALWNEELKK